MASPRSAHTAALLDAGTVLVAGGEGSGHADLNGAEYFDPSTGTFTAVGNMTTARCAHTATRLPNALVLIAGVKAAACRGRS